MIIIINKYILTQNYEYPKRKLLRSLFDVVYIVDSSIIDYNRVKEIIIDAGSTTVKGFLYI